MRIAIVALAIVGIADQELVAQESREGLVEEIIVTATRRATALKDTPLGMTALAQEELEAIGARDIVGYFEHVAGLDYTEDTFAGYRIVTRGIAAGTFIETRPLSAFYLDETPMMALASGSAISPQWGGARPQAVDIARVEVLRGPQGTLFGASTMGGTVRMITNAPDPEQFYGNVGVEYSSTSHGGSNHMIDGFLNIPIIDDALVLRVVGYRREDDGYINNIATGIGNANDVRTTGGRLAILWNATSNLSFTARALEQSRDSGGMSAADVGVGEYEQVRFFPERDDETWRLFTLDIDYDLPWAQLKFVNSHLDREPSLTLDITPLVERIFVFSPTGNDIRDGVDDTIHELRLTSTTDGRVSWVAGAYYQDQERTWIQEWISPGFDALTGGLAAGAGYADRPFHGRFSGRLRQRALYGEVSYQLSPAWEATVGARLFDFEYSIDNFSDGLINGGPASIQASSTESGVTPKVGLAFRPNDRVLVFANAAEGYRPGGTNEYTDQNVVNCTDTLIALGLPVPPARGFESDSLWNVELGTRTTWLDRRLDLNATVYHVRWDDMQTTRTIDCGIDLINIIENVGKATTNGLELELVWNPTDVFEIGVGMAYTDARLAEDAPNISGEDGERIPMVPEWAFNASATARFALSSRAEGFARAAYHYVDGSWSDFDEAIRRRTPSRQVLDLRFGAGIGNWQFELFADNVLDERRVILHFNNTFLGEWNVLMRPRTVGVLARVGF